MQKIKLIVFDLDGTLIESSNTIYKTTKKTLEVLNVDSNINKSELDKRIGEHFQTIFNDLNIPVKDIEEYIDIYKTIYFDFIDESIPYPNIEKILEWLKLNNYLISLLTTKAQEQADAIINHFNYKKYFDLVFGRRNGLKVKPSPEPLLFIANSLNIDIEDTMIVGDTELDIQCGKTAGAKTCAVSYGYRNRNILEKENPDFIIDDILELKNIIA